MAKTDEKPSRWTSSERSNWACWIIVLPAQTSSDTIRLFFFFFLFSSTRDDRLVVQLAITQNSLQSFFRGMDSPIRRAVRRGGKKEINQKHTGDVKASIQPITNALWHARRGLISQAMGCEKITCFRCKSCCQPMLRIGVLNVREMPAFDRPVVSS